MPYTCITQLLSFLFIIMLYPAPKDYCAYLPQLLSYSNHNTAIIALQCSQR